MVLGIKVMVTFNGISGDAKQASSVIEGFCILIQVVVVHLTKLTEPNCQAEYNI